MTSDERSRLRGAFALLPKPQKVFRSHQIEVSRPDTIVVRVKKSDLQTPKGRKQTGDVSITVGHYPDLVASSMSDVATTHPGSGPALARRALVIDEVRQLTHGTRHRESTKWLYDACDVMELDEGDRAVQVLRLIAACKDDKVVQESQMQSGQHSYNNGVVVATDVAVPYAETCTVAPVDTLISSIMKVSGNESYYEYSRSGPRETLEPDVELEGFTSKAIFSMIYHAVHSGLREG